MGSYFFASPDGLIKATQIYMLALRMDTDWYQHARILNAIEAGRQAPNRKPARCGRQEA
jgi:hypothetical protein